MRLFNSVRAAAVVALLLVGGLLFGPVAAQQGPIFLQGLTGTSPVLGNFEDTTSGLSFPRSKTTQVNNHLATSNTSGTAPALTSCGGGTPTISGTDTAGLVTMGTSATGCVITFNVAYTGIPYCVVQWIATPLASQSYVTSATAITLTQTSTSGNVVQYICIGRTGG